MQDTTRLTNDLRSMLTNLYPSLDETKLSIKLEEILVNYNNTRKEQSEIEKDIEEKIQMFINSKKLEGLSPITLMNYEIELNVFSRGFDKAVSQITTNDIRTYLSSHTNWMTSTLSTR